MNPATQQRVQEFSQIFRRDTELFRRHTIDIDGGSTMTKKTNKIHRPQKGRETRDRLLVRLWKASEKSKVQLWENYYYEYT